MRRREFITLLGGASVAWPLVARAQQAMPVIGSLSTVSVETSRDYHAAFYQGLSSIGYVVGQNLTVESRWAEGRYDRLPEFAADLVRRQVAVIAAFAPPAVLAAKAATATIPIVATFDSDPVASGLVASLNRPGGNATGVSVMTSMLEPKRLGLLSELVPQAATLGVLLNPNFPSAVGQLRDIQGAARTLGLQLDVLRAGTDREIDTAFESAAQHRLPALVVAADPFFLGRRDKLAALAVRHAMPTMSSFREYAVAGGLMSYGIDLLEMYRQIGIYAGRILKGDKPGDLPVVQPTRFNLVINLKTAKSLGLDMPSTLLTLADEVIE
jgi:putative tryptophan/tyrosine transport system substrate-binding protein